jgi:HTH-type transcriptional regulator / antitoxin HigA
MQHLKPKRMSNHDTSTLTTDALAIKLSSLININSGNYDFTLPLIEELIESYSEHPVLIEALAYAIARYEDESDYCAEFNQRQRELDPSVAALTVIMDQHGLNTKDFESEIGKEPLVSQILAGKDLLTRGQARKLAQRFGVSPAFLDKS